MDKDYDKDVCWKCENLLEEDRIGKNAYCLKCHREVLVKPRKPYSELTDEQKQKVNARAYVNQYIRRGRVIRGKCEVCQDYNTQAHHDDYSKPLDVRWFCEKHHLSHHGKIIRNTPILD